MLRNKAVCAALFAAATCLLFFPVVRGMFGLSPGLGGSNGGSYKLYLRGGSRAAARTDNCRLTNMSAFMTFLLGYCIYQAERSIKAYIHCESLCRTGHCAHHLHASSGPFPFSASRLQRTLGGAEQTVSSSPSSSPYFLQQVFDVGAMALLLALKVVLAFASGFTFNNIYDCCRRLFF